MRIFRSFLVIFLSLALVAGAGSFLEKREISAAQKEIMRKPDSDFMIRLPAAWKNKYVIKKSRNKTHGSYVSFSSKKCSKETGDGWFFSIMRYKDDSYEDELSGYELAGMWNGIRYVAVFPTEIQTFGVSKAAKKEYQKLNGYSWKTAFMIQPVKRGKKEKGIYRVSDFSFKLPTGWKNKFSVEQNGKKGKDLSVTFYEKKCHEQTGAGWLFSIESFRDESYQELPAYELAGKWNGMSYVAVFPTDVQFEGASKDAVKQYQKLSKSVEKVARSIGR